MHFVSLGEARYGTPTVLRTYGVPLLVSVVAFFVPSEWLIWAFVVFGQGHFLMSFLYQYRAGKVRGLYLVVLCALLALFAGYVVLFGEYAFWPLLLIAFLFPLHFAYDEFTLYGHTFTRANIATLTLFVLMCFSATLFSAYKESSVVYYALLVSGTVFVLYALSQMVLSKRTIPQGEYYLWCVGILMLILASVGRPEQVLSSIIILHGFNWLVAFAYRVQSSPVEKKTFWQAFYITHGFGLFGFLVYLHLSVPALKYFFMLLYYDFWALAHVSLTALSFKRRSA